MNSNEVHVKQEYLSYSDALNLLVHHHLEEDLTPSNSASNIRVKKEFNPSPDQNMYIPFTDNNTFDNDSTVNAYLPYKQSSPSECTTDTGGEGSDYFTPYGEESNINQFADISYYDVCSYPNASATLLHGSTTTTTTNSTITHHPEYILPPSYDVTRNQDSLLAMMVPGPTCNHPHPISYTSPCTYLPDTYYDQSQRDSDYYKSSSDNMSQNTHYISNEFNSIIDYRIPPKIDVNRNLNKKSKSPKKIANCITYLKMIAESIMQHSNNRVLLNDIYSYVLSKYPECVTSKPTWKNSIRHNLSINKCFKRDGRSPTGRGYYWVIADLYLSNFKKGQFSHRK